jgi:hypothetical protein
LDASISLLGPDRSPDGSIALGDSGQSRGSAALALMAEDNRGAGGHVDQVRDSLREEMKLEAGTIAAGATASIGLSVGYVIWLLRGGVLLSTVMTSMPMWRLIDPLPVLGNVDADGDDDSDDSLEAIVARTNHTSEAEAEAEADRSERAEEGAVA